MVTYELDDAAPFVAKGWVIAEAVTREARGADEFNLPRNDVLPWLIVGAPGRPVEPGWIRDPLEEEPPCLES